jgi:hypothetical protein
LRLFLSVRASLSLKLLYSPSSGSYYGCFSISAPFRFDFSTFLRIVSLFTCISIKIIKLVSFSNLLVSIYSLCNKFQKNEYLREEFYTMFSDFRDNFSNLYQNMEIYNAVTKFNQNHCSLYFDILFRDSFPVISKPIRNARFSWTRLSIFFFFVFFFSLVTS